MNQTRKARIVRLYNENCMDDFKAKEAALIEINESLQKELELQKSVNEDYRNHINELADKLRAIEEAQAKKKTTRKKKVEQPKPEDSSEVEANADR